MIGSSDFYYNKYRVKPCSSHYVIAMIISKNNRFFIVNQFLTASQGLQVISSKITHNSYLPLNLKILMKKMVKDQNWEPFYFPCLKIKNLLLLK